MKNTLRNIFLFLGMGAVLSACFQDPGTSITLANSAVVEIQEATTSAGLDITKTYAKAGGSTAVKDSLRVNLVGPVRTAATNVSFVVDTAIPAPGVPAVAGVHYTLTTPNSITIPAGSSFGYIKFTVNPQVIAPSETFKLKINLTTSDVSVSVNYGSFTRSLKAS